MATPNGRWARFTADIQRNDGGPAMDWRTLFVLLVTPILLTVFYYYGRPQYFFTELQGWAEGTFGAGWEYMELAAFGYWAAACLLLRVLLPLALIVWVMRHHPRDYGYRIRGSAGHIPVYALLFVAVLPFLYWASTQDSFLDRYPFYKLAHLGGLHFWAYELFYFIQFFALEAFFRGFVLFGLARRFGYYAVLIMVIPYCMIHFNKPFSEAVGAVFAGIVLGVLALRSGSFYLGVLVHGGVAITMDLLALQQL